MDRLSLDYPVADEAKFEYEYRNPNKSEIRILNVRNHEATGETAGRNRSDIHVCLSMRIWIIRIWDLAATLPFKPLEWVTEATLCGWRLYALDVLVDMS